MSRKCPGCRCRNDTNNRCKCCNRWPVWLTCVDCKRLGTLDNMVLTHVGVICDGCLSDIRWLDEPLTPEEAACLAQAYGSTDSVPW